MRRAGRRVRVRRSGTFELNLPPDERALLASLPRQLAETLAELDPHEDVPDELRRLFPVAHPRDDQAERTYVSLVRGTLAREHREALEMLARTAEATELEASELEGWLTALNDLRLVLGVALDVTEDPPPPDPEDPRFAEWLCYHYLSLLQSEVVEALSDVLPPPRPGADEELPDDPWGEPPGGLRWDGTERPDQ